MMTSTSELYFACLKLFLHGPLLVSKREAHYLDSTLNSKDSQLLLRHCTWNLLKTQRFHIWLLEVLEPLMDYKGSTEAAHLLS